MTTAKTTGNNGQPDAALLALIREHRIPVPAGDVGWDALAARIVADARPELAARQRSGGVTGLRAPLGMPAPRQWWEVTAGWARPAIAAAIVVCAISTAVMLSSPIVTVADAGDSGAGTGTSGAASAWLQTLDAAAGVTTAPAVNRDSLLSEVVGQ